MTILSTRKIQFQSEEMPPLFIETQKLLSYDKRALGVFYQNIENLRNKRLTREEALSIYEEGIVFV